MFARYAFVFVLGVPSLFACSGCGKAKEREAAAATVNPHLRELDVSAIGEAWKGHIAMTPPGAQLLVDPRLMHQKIALHSGDKVLIAPTTAEQWAEMAKETLADPQAAARQIDDRELAWHNNDPGQPTIWAGAAKLDVGGKLFECSAETQISEAALRELMAICRSIRKK